mmetsp:Transcript_15920/g.62206  ORF Transcript_15920/g.62206 Transcript_15920/m.62206 type:complete len:266 (-) Transcript_15920:39-836(-)
MHCLGCPSLGVGEHMANVEELRLLGCTVEERVHILGASLSCVVSRVLLAYVECGELRMALLLQHALLQLEGKVAALVCVRLVHLDQLHLTRAHGLGVSLPRLRVLGSIRLQLSCVPLRNLVIHIVEDTDGGRRRGTSEAPGQAGAAAEGLLLAARELGDLLTNFLTLSLLPRLVLGQRGWHALVVWLHCVLAQGSLVGRLSHARGKGRVQKKGALRHTAHDVRVTQHLVVVACKTHRLSRCHGRHLFCVFSSSALLLQATALLFS